MPKIMTHKELAELRKASAAKRKAAPFPFFKQKEPERLPLTELKPARALTGLPD